MVAIINFVVDPYSLFQTIKVGHLKLQKTELAHHSRLYKTQQVIERKPDVIVLGDSKPLLGIDVSSPLLAGRGNAYNLALDGADMHECACMFRHALANQPALKLVVISLDFQMFNLDHVQPDEFNEQRLGMQHLPLSDWINSTFSLDALASSASTIWNSGKIPVYFAENGNRTDDSLYVVPFSERWRLYSKKNGVDFKLSERQLAEFQSVVDSCRARHIELIVLSPPAYGEPLNSCSAETIANARDAIRRIARIHPVWDFGSDKVLADEPLSPAIKNYFDPFHFTKRVGNLILARVFNDQAAELPANFGVFTTAPRQISLNGTNTIRQALAY